MGITHKFQSARADAPDNGDVHPRHWNEAHEVTGILGKFLEVAEQPSSFPYVKPDGTGSVTAISELTRGLLSLLTDAEFRAAIGAVASSGDAMTGALAMGNNRITGLGTPTASADAVTKAYADGILAAVSGALRFIGAWDASAGTFPGGGDAQTGAFYKVSVAGTVDDVLFEVGDDVFAVVDDASEEDYADNWLKIEGGISLAEVEAAVGFTFGSLAAASAVTASQISDASANARSLLQAEDFAAMRTLLGLGTAALLDTGTGPNQVVKLDGSSKLPAVDGSNLTNLPGGFSGSYGDLSGKPDLGTAAAKDVGTSAGNVVEVQTGGKLPALDASDLTNVPATGGETVGGIKFFPANVAPTGWVKANGALLSRTTYAALYAYAAASGNIVAEASWSTNKGAFSTGDTSSTFRIPDLRGVFMRGWDDSAGVDSGRAIGSSQADDNKSHFHTNGRGGTTSADNNGSSPTSVMSSSASATGSSGGAEARPKNVAGLACIKY